MAFPRGRPGHPLGDDRIGQHLHKIGIQLRQDRSTALFTLATEVPAAILARMLGVHIKVAVQWQQASGGDWAAYAADVAQQNSDNHKLESPNVIDPNVTLAAMTSPDVPAFHQIVHPHEITAELRRELIDGTATLVMANCTSRLAKAPRSRPLSRDRTRCPRCPASGGTTR
jgi:hypothetical protein